MNANSTAGLTAAVRRPRRQTIAASMILLGIAAAPTGAVSATSPAGSGSTMHTMATTKAKPPYALRVTRRTATVVGLRWRGPGTTKGRFVVYLNRRVVARTARSTFTFRKLRCGTRNIVGVRRGGSRISAVRVRTLPCTEGTAPGGGSSGSGGSSGGTTTTPPGTFPAGSGGNGLPARLAPSTGATFHVATTGNDGNPGSAAQPWRTVGKAIATLAPGQIALVHSGVYNESVWTKRSGTAAAPITIQGAPNEAKPILRAADAAYALTLASGARYMRFQGIVFEGASKTDAPANVTIENGSGQFEFLGCEVRGSTRFGLYTEEQTSGVQIIASYIHDNGGSGPSDRDHNVYLMGTDHVVTSSLISGASNGYGIQVYPSNARAVISANTIVRNSRGGIILGGEGGQTTTGARVIGNILALNGGPGLSTYWGGSQGGDNLVRTNLAWGNGQAQITGTGITVQGTIGADPRFAGSAAGDFRLAADSPAIGAGEPAFTPATDLLGGARPQGSGPDLGAYER